LNWSKIFSHCTFDIHGQFGWLINRVSLVL
jgi:hypothetical protein